MKHQQDAWPASRMANKRRSRSGVSFARPGTQVAAFHGELNSRAASLECVMHPTPKDDQDDQHESVDPVLEQTRGRFWPDPAAMLMLLERRLSGSQR